jgi:hypothetical protein
LPLSHRPFVVQLHAGINVAAEHLVGRVEHVVAGQATTFHILEGLRAFFEYLLAHAG